MTEVIELVKVGYDKSPGGTETEKITSRREVFCRIRSIGMREAYKAMEVNRNPEIAAVLADRLDYDGEQYVIHDSTVYKVSRTFSTGIKLELVLERTRDLEGMV